MIESTSNIEVVTDDDEAITGVMADGSMEFDLATLMGEKSEEDEVEEEFYENLADKIPDNILSQLASDLVKNFEDDSSSRKEWIQTYVDGLDLLGLKIESRTEPWPGACGVYHPILSEALIKFQAETIMETFPPAGPVKTVIIGKETPAKKQASINVAADMNYQLTEVMAEYRPEHERLLWGLGLSGNAFKKIYFDPALNRQAALFVPAEDLVVPYGASNLESAERVTHIMRKTKNEVRKLQVDGFYVDTDLGDPAKNATNLDEVEKKIAENMGFSATSDDRFKLLEMHTLIDLSEYDYKDKKTKDDGIAVPYVVTIEKNTNIVLGVYRNWAESDEKKLKREHFVHYPYIPGFGFYAFGLVHLLGSFAKSGTSLIRQLVDAGTLSNLPGGYKTKGLRVKGDDTPISPGEFRDVDVASGSIKDNLMTLPYKEPSQVLLALLQSIVEEGRRFASTTDLQASDMSAQAPVGTTLAILERTLKIMSAVQSRIHYAMKREFKLLATMIRDFTPKDYAYEPEEGSYKAKRDDYSVVEVVPVSDPNASTMAQKVTQYQAVLQLAADAPGIYDMAELHKQMLEVLQIKNIGKIIPSKEEQEPKDPVSENMDILNAKPVKAFITQDHASHIAVHMSMTQDPKLQEIMQQNPQAGTIMAAGMAHVLEHVGFQYRADIEKQMGITLPAPDEKLPQDVEVELSKLLAQAAGQLVQQQQAEEQQAQQEEAEKDPLNVIQREELRIKEKQIDLNAELGEKRLLLDAAVKADELEQKGVATETKTVLDIAKLELAASKSNHDAAIRTAEREHRSFLEAGRLDVDLKKHKDSLDAQKEMAVINAKSNSKDKGKDKDKDKGDK